VRRRLAYLLVWTIGTVATVGATWLGLQSVLRSTGPARMAPLTAAELSNPPSNFAPVPAFAAPPVPVVDESIPPITLPDPTTQPSSANPAPTATSSAPPTDSGTAVPQTVPGTPGGTTDPSTSVWVRVPDGHGGIGYERTFHLIGGDVTVLSEPFDVRVVSTDPKPGYVALRTWYDYRSVLVSMVSSSLTSRVYVTWRYGPYAEITESAT
jgi:hypothetical protein